MDLTTAFGNTFLYKVSSNFWLDRFERLPERRQETIIYLKLEGMSTAEAFKTVYKADEELLENFDTTIQNLLLEYLDGNNF